MTEAGHEARTKRGACRSSHDGAQVLVGQRPLQVTRRLSLVQSWTGQRTVAGPRLWTPRRHHITGIGQEVAVAHVDRRHHILGAGMRDPVLLRPIEQATGRDVLKYAFP